MIRLQRKGAKKRPFYKVVVIEKSTKRDGKFIEELGGYNPLIEKEKALNLDIEKLKTWQAKGAQLSKRVASIVKKCQIKVTQEQTA